MKCVVDELILDDPLLGHVRPDTGSPEDAPLRVAEDGVVPEDRSRRAAARHDLELAVRGENTAADVRRERALGGGADVRRQKDLEKVPPDDFVLAVPGDV